MRLFAVSYAYIVEEKTKPYRKKVEYEDNPKVVPNRILASETMAEYFLRNFNNGFVDSIFDSIYSNVSLISLTGYKNNVTQS